METFEISIVKQKSLMIGAMSIGLHPGNHLQRKSSTSEVTSKSNSWFF